MGLDRLVKSLEPKRRRRPDMLILVAEHLTRLYSGFNVFSYLTMRAILAR